MENDNDNKDTGTQAQEHNLDDNFIQKLVKALQPYVSKEVNTGFSKRFEQTTKSVAKNAGLELADDQDIVQALKSVSDENKKLKEQMQSLIKEKKAEQQKVVDYRAKETIKGKLKSLSIKDEFISDYTDKWYDLDKRIGLNDNGQPVVRFVDSLGNTVEEGLDTGLAKLVNTEYKHLLSQKQAPQNPIAGSVHKQLFNK